eukprot:TRINITY_DN3578_c0_g1_i1.p1 TRINITY_DN3578_c0_g1~~TRINITY_DN3578_c0_g1_i1.p1  ORF type:complete len:253 (-),score=-14.64 TRINITY_DN3578_c0_g1_i1:305-1063(-)
MLAYFRSGISGGPEELRSPTARKDKWKSGAEIMKTFVESRNDAVCVKLEVDGAIACSHLNQQLLRPRSLACFDDITCIFVGYLDNLAPLRRQYGLPMNVKEEIIVIEAYKALRDRSPYPADQVLKDFSGGFAFVLYDIKTHTIFTAADKEGKVQMYWGAAFDGSLVFTDEQEVVKEGCDKSYAPFPCGCMFWNREGLQSFEHPLCPMQAVKRVDSQGQMCGATFRVDKMSRVSSIPRVGSSADWSGLYSFAR